MLLYDVQVWPLLLEHVESTWGLVWLLAVVFAFLKPSGLVAEHGLVVTMMLKNIPSLHRVARVAFCVFCAPNCETRVVLSKFDLSLWVLVKLACTNIVHTQVGNDLCALLCCAWCLGATNARLAPARTCSIDCDSCRDQLLSQEACVGVDEHFGKFQIVGGKRLKIREHVQVYKYLDCWQIQ